MVLLLWRNWPSVTKVGILFLGSVFFVRVPIRGVSTRAAKELRGT